MDAADDPSDPAQPASAAALAATALGEPAQSTERVISDPALEATALPSVEIAFDQTSVATLAATQPGVRRPVHSPEGTLRSVSGSSRPAAAVASAASSMPSGVPSSEEVELSPFGPYTRFEVLAEQGSIGLVARGYNEGFGRWELLKFLRAELAGDVELVRQFRREGRVLAQLSHPNVVQVFATYDLRGRTCLAMEFLEGDTLEALVRAAGPLGAERGRELLTDAARGLAAAHEVGLLHRDIKPANLFVTARGAGRAAGLKLIDFGLATADRARLGSPAESDPSLVSGAVGGTPLYMAPELWRGEEATAASDLYALGVTFYVALSGRYPLDAPSVAELRRSLLGLLALPSLASVRGDLPAALIAIVDRLLSKSAADRFSSADELLAALVASAGQDRPRRIPVRGPYPGLAAFGEDDCDVLFGRERELTEICERLRLQSALVLVGPQGCGKSSLLHGGVVPSLRAGALGGAIVHRSVSVALGHRPWTALLSALAAALEIDVRLLESTVREQPARLAAAVRSALGGPHGVIVAVDALEQLVSPRVDAREALACATGLASLAGDAEDRIRLVATARSEAMDRLLAIESLGRLLTRGFHPVRVVSGSALERALGEPARAAGYGFEDATVLTVIEDAARPSMAALGLASLALQRWWERRDDARKLLTAEAWRELGGVSGALVAHAEANLRALEPELRSAADAILARISTEGGGEASAPRAALEDPAVSGSAGRAALDRLISAQVLLESAGSISLVHPVLARDWPHLRGLVQGSPEERRLREAVVAAARDWDQSGRRAEALWDGDRAQELARWISATAAPLGQAELAFAEAVRTRLARRRFARRAALAGAALVLGIGLLAARVGERDARRRLDQVTRDLQTAKSSYVSDTRKLLDVAARGQVTQDPGEALRTAQRARDLSSEGELDVVGWRAVWAGVARALPRHSGGSRSAAWNPKGTIAATTGVNGPLRLAWMERAKQREVASPRGRDDAATVVAFSKEGGKLMFGTAQGALAVVDVEQGNAREIGHCVGAVTGLYTGADGSTLARCAAGASTERALLISRDGEALQVLAEPAAGVTVDTRGEHVAWIAADGRVGTFEVSTRKTERHDGLTATAIAYAADGRSLVAGDQDGRVARLAPGRPPEPWRALPAFAAVASISAAPDGRHWLVLDAAGRGVLLGAELSVLATLDGVTAPIAWIDARRAVALSTRNNSIVLLASDTGTELGRLSGATRAVIAIDVDAQGQRLIATSRDGGVRVWSLDQAAAVVLRAPDGARCAAVPDASGLACVQAGTLSRQAAEASLADAATAMKLTGPAGAEPTTVAAGAQGAATWAGPAGPVFRALRLGVPAAGAAPAWRVSELLGPDGAVQALAFASSSESLALASTGADGKPALALQSGADRPLTPLPAPPGRITSLSFSADDSLLLAGGADGSLQVVDLGAGSSHGLKPFDRTEVTAAVASPDGTLVAAANALGRVVMLPVDGGEPRLLLSVHERVRCLAWSRAGRALLVGSASGAVRVVDLETMEAVPLLAMPSAVVGCARKPGDDVFVIVAEDGGAYRRTLDFAPVWTQRAPDDPLDPVSGAPEAWKGLESPDAPR